MVAALLNFQLQDEDGIACLYGQLDVSDFDAAVADVAAGIAKNRLDVTPELHQIWTDQVNAPSPPDPSQTHKELLKAYLLTNIGTPSNPAPDEHLHGLIAEHIWRDVISQRDMGIGLPIRIEGHDWSVTETGGDGLAVYSAGGDFQFRLWESKYHGAAGPIRDTTNRACRQMKKRALEYLARFSMISQRETGDPQLATFYAGLAQMWVDRDPAVGVGIAIAASDDDGQSSHFDRVSRYFDLAVECHQAQLNTLIDFPELARQVRQTIWKGCGSWTGP